MGRRRYMYVASERQISIKGSSEGKKLRGEKSTATVLRYAFEGSSSQSIHVRWALWRCAALLARTVAEGPLTVSDAECSQILTSRRRLIQSKSTCSLCGSSRC